MTENEEKGFSKEDIISLAQIKQTLVILGGVLTLVVIILPLVLSRLYTKLDSINANTVKIATIGIQISNLQRDIDRIMIWMDRERNSGSNSRIMTSELIVKEFCDIDCNPALYSYIETGEIDDN